MSLQNWNYFNPVRVVFAPGAVARLDEIVSFQRVVLVTSPGFTRRGVTDRVRQSLGKRLVAVLDDVKPNPDVRDIDVQAARIRGLHPDCILALGGGSSMDTAKALAKLMTQSEAASVARYFREDSIWQDSAALPLVTVPTTAGTGSEVTPFATVWDFETHKKHSVTGVDLYAHTAILDPELMVGLPHEVTISSGLDAVSHALESVWNRNASVVTLGLASKSLQLSLDALPRLHADGTDAVARGDMMQASLLAGLAISQTRTALAHSISYPLTAHFGLPHGVACSFTLPALLRFNAKVDDGRLKCLASAVGYGSATALADGLETIFSGLEIAGLFTKYIPEAHDVMSLMEEMLTPGRADNNLRDASVDDIRHLLQNSLSLTMSAPPSSE